MPIKDIVNGHLKLQDERQCLRSKSVRLSSRLSTTNNIAIKIISDDEDVIIIIIFRKQNII